MRYSFAGVVALFIWLLAAALPGWATNAVPTVAFTSPSEGASLGVSTTYTLNASAADADGTIAKVQFFEGTVFLGEDVVAPFTYSWTAPNTPGTYTLSAVATDNLGATSAPAVLHITVTAKTLALALSATSSLNVPLPVNTPVTLTASASGFTNPQYLF